MRELDIYVKRLVKEECVMGLVRFVVIGLLFWIIAIIIVLILDITFTSFGLPLNVFTEIPLQLLILYYGVSKFGIKKRIKNKYNDFPN